MELTKSDKKIARAIIEKGLQIEFGNGLNTAQRIIESWKVGKTDSREAYLALFKQIKNFDKHIAWRYNNMSGSKYIYIIAGQIIDKIISKEELEEFSESAKENILQIVKLHRSYDQE
jgi:hypothetical protein